MILAHLSAGYQLIPRVLYIVHTLAVIAGLLLSVFELEQLVLELAVLLLEGLDHLEQLLVDLGLVLAHGLLGVHVGNEQVSGLLARVGGEETLKLTHLSP